MSRELLVMRHAKSDWGTQTMTDFERPLNSRGEKAAAKMGRWLQQQNLTPDYVVSSPALRAKQTSELVCAELGIETTGIHWQQAIYEASLMNLRYVLAECSASAKRVLLVGHNPGLEYLVAYLSASVPPQSDGKLMPTATIAQIELPDDWTDLDEGCGQLLSLTRPKGLSD